ncbi:MAG: BolA family transcriptional regulator [SAR86 cluster bacterium]|uniref:BolA family transcriptional regulator n=1 Tax=SAR86 cluster bacterium TaxID=2030880 RepID=A0A2A5BAC2_9GAMM|nr:MAG: BolA family transcriptional regulator [SAR86 cluster bacterium]
MMEDILRSKLEADLQPGELIIENESHMHGGPATESHFNLTVVSTQFKETSPVKRHQRVYKILSAELASSVHALALHLYTPEEWKKRQQATPESPNCRGGSE